MARKPKLAASTNPKKKPATPAKTSKPRCKRQPKRAWLTALMDYFGNYILLVLLAGLILWLALIFRGLFDRFM